MDMTHSSAPGVTSSRDVIVAKLNRPSSLCSSVHLYIFTGFFPISPGGYAAPPPSPPSPPGPPRVLSSCQSLTKGSRFFQISS